MKAESFWRLRLVRRLFVYGAGVVLFSFVALEAVQHLVFGLPDEFVLWHLLYVIGFTALLLGPLSVFLLRSVLRPLSRMVEANRAATEGCTEVMFIPDEEIPDSEVGEVMRSRNEMLEDLRRKERWQLERLRLTTLGVDVGIALTQEDPLGRMLQECAEALVRNLDVAFARIWRFEPKSNTLELQASAGMYTHLDGSHSRVPVDGHLKVGRIARERRPYLTNAVIGDPCFSDQAWARQEGMVAFAGYPLTVGDRLVGVMGMFARHPLTDATLKALASVADTIALGVERKRVEEEHARMSMAAEQAVEAIMIMDPDWTVVYVNPAFERITGYSRMEVIGRHPRLLRSGKHDEAFYGAMMSAVERGEVWSGHIISTRKDGSLMEGDTIISPVRDTAGRIVNYVSVERDVTQEVMLEAKLRQAQKMEAVGTLAGGIAHDFNNILTAIIGAAELALLLPTGDPRWPEYVARIPRQGYQAANLIGQLLTFSRRAPSERQPMDLLPLAKETIKMLARTVPEHIALRLSASVESATVNADPTQMQQVIMNLCVNASQAMPHGGDLVLGLEGVTLDEAYCLRYPDVAPGDYVCLRVRDTGTGMTPEVQARIFEPFFTTKEEGKGTGLGLAMVYGIVKAHGGHVALYSEVGLGSEFKVYLPAVQAGAKALTVAAETPPPRGTETVLMVEDEAMVLATGREILKRLGYTVLSAKNGVEALEVFRARSEEIALVLTDMVMPQMGGYDLFRELKQLDPTVKVLLVSGYSVTHEVEDLRGRGMKGFVQKPFNISRLGRAVRQAIDEP